MKKEISTSKIIRYTTLVWTILEALLVVAIFIIWSKIPDEIRRARWVITIGLLAFALTIIHGNIIVILCVRFLGKPIERLTLDIENITYGNTPKLKRTKVLELNRMMDSIEKLSHYVSNYSTTLANIIDVFSIGVFFYPEDSDEVYCSQAFFDICEIYEIEGHMNRKDFDKIYEELTHKPQAEYPSAFKINDNKVVSISTRQENDFILGIVTDVTSQIQEIKKLEYERDYDHLTKLYNRPAFAKKVERYFEDDEHQIIAVIMWDIDKLKYINDTYGHDAGDIYIKKFAEIIKELEKYGGIVARRSGDEFLGLIAGNNHIQIIDIINQIRDKINNTTVLFSEQFSEKIRVSMGIAWYPEDGEDLETLLNSADFALYEVKFSFDKNLIQDTLDFESFKHHYSKEFDNIIEGNSITFAYQPIVSAKDGSVLGYEMLMRIFSEIINSLRKLMMIGKIYSKTHLIESITFTRAFEEYNYNLERFQGMKIFVNSISSIILADKTLKQIAKPYSNNLDMLVVEIKDFGDAEEEILMNKIEVLKKYEAEFLIDGFEGDVKYFDKIGFYPHYVKIDLSIINNIHKDLYHQKELNKILDYCKKNGIKTIAFGIKSLEEMKYLIKAGVDYLQGNYIGIPSARAIPIDEDLVKKIKRFQNNS